MTYPYMRKVQTFDLNMSYILSHDRNHDYVMPSLEAFLLSTKLLPAMPHTTPVNRYTYVCMYVYLHMTPSLQHKERISIDKNTRVFSICHNTMRNVKVL